MGELFGESLREDLMLVGVSGGMVLTHSFLWTETKTHINLIETQTPVKPSDSAGVSKAGEVGRATNNRFRRESSVNTL